MKITENGEMLFDVGDVADAMGETYISVWRAIQSGVIEGPKTPYLTRVYYTQDDVQKLKKQGLK
jgi:hypothetical protein